MTTQENAPDHLRRALVLGVASLAAGCQPGIGAELPTVALPGIAGLKTAAGWDLPGVDTAKLKGQVSILNIWASWCPYCRGEHDILKGLSRAGRAPLIGLVHNDTAEKARNYLKQAGNPFAALSVDPGKITGALGQRGVPHTYVIGKDLKVALKIPGALSEGIVSSQILPAVDKALRA